MGGTLDYHIERDGLVLSLCYLEESERGAASVVEDLWDDAPDDVEVHTEVSELQFKTTVYAIYVAESHPHQLPENWDEGLSDSDIILADAIITSFTGVMERWKENGKPLNWYKKPEPSRFPEAFERVEWRQSVPEVAGEIMSNLIWTHALPNANHRTAVAFVRTYLQSVTGDTNGDIPSAGDYDGEWFDWAKEYIYESKRLLLLGRKRGLLNYAKRQGVETITRKGGIEVDLTAHDFDGAARQQAKTGHRNRCTAFCRELIERSDYDLLDAVDPGKRTFVDRLR